jgi:flagellar biosynthesis regulator FlbT
MRRGNPLIYSAGSAIRSLIPSHRELLRSKAVVVSVAEKSGHDPVRHG